MTSQTSWPELEMDQAKIIDFVAFPLDSHGNDGILNVMGFSNVMHVGEMTFQVLRSKFLSTTLWMWARNKSAMIQTLTVSLVNMVDSRTPMGCPPSACFLLAFLDNLLSLSGAKSYLFSAFNEYYIVWIFCHSALRPPPLVCNSILDGACGISVPPYHVSTF